MAMVLENSVDVICQHFRDGRVIPIKFRVTDEDGAYQMYSVREFKEVEVPPDRIFNGVFVVVTKTVFECKIIAFGRERRVYLHYDSNDGTWKYYA